MATSKTSTAKKADEKPPRGSTTAEERNDLTQAEQDERHPNSQPQPSDALDGAIPRTREQAAATEAISPQERDLDDSREVHNALAALEQRFAAIPLTESKRRPTVDDLDEINDLLDEAKKAVAAHKRSVKKES